MNLPKAIEILELKNQGWVAPAEQDLSDAIKEGIKALEEKLERQKAGVK